ncbi:MAG: hypothetical protein HOE53_00865 [Candidatus Magasanikbacteria bacterium]|nr:hypothetical protein [Candidatus Magasanikbacteria bacterium]
MKEPTYRSALSHGWNIFWDHKLLWLFGFFAAFLGQMGLLDIITQLNLAPKQYTMYEPISNLPEIIAFIIATVKALPWDAGSMVWSLWLLIFFGGAALLLVFVSVTSQGALIHGIGQSLKGRKKKHIDVSKAWHAGTGHFWRLFFLHIAKKVSLFTVMVIAGLAAYSYGMSGAPLDAGLFYAALILAVAVGVITSFLLIYAAGYVVIEEYSFGEAIKAAWALFKDHWLVSLEVAAIMVLVNILFAIVSAAVFLLFVGEMAIILAGSLVLSAGALYTGMLIFGSLLFATCLAFFGSLLTVFSTSTWMYLFATMHKKGMKSRIHHTFARLLKRR